MDRMYNNHMPMVALAMHEPVYSLRYIVNINRIHLSITNSNIICILKIIRNEIQMGLQRKIDSPSVCVTSEWVRTSQTVIFRRLVVLQVSVNHFYEHKHTHTQLSCLYAAACIPVEFCSYHQNWKVYGLKSRPPPSIVSQL